MKIHLHMQCRVQQLNYWTFLNEHTYESMLA